MKKNNRFKRLLAVILSVSLLFGAAFPVSASAANSADKSVAAVQVFDKVFDFIADVIIRGALKALLSADTLGWLVKSNAFPTVDEYFAQDHEYFYEGTDGKVQGDGWKLGYSYKSVLPTEWRRNADGKKDPNGMCLDKTHFFGGYFGSKVKDIYDDQQVYLTVLSAGNDANKNGVDDVIIFAAMDNIGFSNGSVRDVRKAVSEALAKKGLAADDIISFEFCSTHAHTVIEALGMSPDEIFLTAVGNHFLFRKNTAVEDALLATICSQAANAACEAYDKMEDGNLYYFETDNINDYMKANAVNNNGQVGDTIRDKLEYGAGCQEFFACWYFESVKGTKTILANIGLHPTFSGRNSQRICADVPYYIWKVMQEQGYQFMFLQGSQAAIGLSGNYTKVGYDYATANALSYDEWVARYGKKYADKRYEGNKNESGEAQYFNVRATGCSIAHFIIDSIDRSQKTAPVYDIKMGEILIPLDHSIMYLAAESNVFGYNTVRCPEAETGYAIVTEIGYVQLGNKVVMITLPGEVSPAITFGTSENYKGEDSWQGENTWSGEEWKYDTLENYAKAALGQDKTIIALGICNDEIGYVMPDTDNAKNFLTKTIFASKDGIVSRGDNEELMMTSCKAGSALAEGYKNFFENLAK